jgi:hypothetical protein
MEHSACGKRSPQMPSSQPLLRDLARLKYKKGEEREVLQAKHEKRGNRHNVARDAVREDNGYTHGAGQSGSKSRQEVRTSGSVCPSHRTRQLSQSFLRPCSFASIGLFVCDAVVIILAHRNKD